MKNIIIFLSENFHFLVVKFSVYLNRLGFVMHAPKTKLSLVAHVCIMCFYVLVAYNACTRSRYTW